MHTQGRVAAAATLIVVALAAAIVATGVSLGSRAASSSDSYGYVSQAHLWRRGALVQPEPLSRAATWANGAATLAPLGYRPANRAYAIVPTYAPGLPILMAVASLAAGPCAIYLVVPLTAGLLVWLTAALAKRVGDPVVAAGAATLVATSPTLLFMMLWPMSDVPVAACWLAALLSATSNRPLTTASLAGLAILIRPNLAPLAIVPLAIIASQRSVSGYRPAWQRAGVAALAIIPFPIAIAVLNRWLYGSAFESGYGAIAGLYSLANIPRNLPLHVRWLYESHGLYVFAFVPAIAWLFRRGTPAMLRWCAGFAGLVWCAYLPYHVYREWWYLRFLLPALPMVYLLAVYAVSAAASRFGETARIAAVTVFVLAAGAHGIGFALAKGIAGVGEGEQRFVEAGRYVRTALPENAIVFATEHSGSVRHYGGRTTLRYDRLEGDWLDRTIERLTAMGLHAYAVLDEGEDRIFREQFAGQQALVHLGAGPIAELDSRIKVRVYDLSPTLAAGVPPSPARIPHISRLECNEPE